MPAVRLEDVARAAGVSPITASRALGNPGRVAEGTRERVLAAARSLGYVPHRAASSLVSARSRIVGAVVPTTHNPIHAVMLQGLAEELGPSGYQIMLGMSGYAPGEERRLVEAFVGHRVDGLVLTGRDHLAETARLIRRAGVPTVEVFEHIPEPIDLNVGSPQWDAGHALGAYLIARGRRRLAFVGHSDFDDRRIAARRDGLAAACAERGAPPPRQFATAGRPGSGDGGGEILGRILRDFPEVEAAVFAGHQIAVGAIHFATSVGIAVPERIAVAAFGDSPVARWIRPRLTTVDFPVLAMGRAAGRLLVTRMAGEPVPSPILRMGFEILARDSA